MRAIPLRTPLVKKGDDIAQLLLDSAGEELAEGAVFAVCGKIISTAQGRVVACADDEMEALARREAEQVFGKGKSGLLMTQKYGAALPNAGVDTSNSPAGTAVLLPTDPWGEACQLRAKLQQRANINNLGVLVIDSCVMPLRRGLVGVALGWAGIQPLADERGNPDVFGNPLAHSQVAVADALASAAQILMGQGAQSVPAVLFLGAPVAFTNAPPNPQQLHIPAEEDLFFGVE